MRGLYLGPPAHHENLTLYPVEVDFVGLDRRVLTVEENVLSGGFGHSVAAMLSAQGLNLPIAMLGVPDQFLPCGDPDSLRATAGIDTSSIVKAALQLCGAQSGEKTA